MNKIKAFTLLEILIVIVVLAVLASIAIPRYTDIVEKSRTSEAMAIFAAIKSAQEVYYSKNGRYRDILDCSPDAVTGALGIEVPCAFEGNADTYFILHDIGGDENGFSATLFRTNKGNSQYSGTDITMTYTRSNFSTQWSGSYPFLPKR